MDSKVREEGIPVIHLIDHKESQKKNLYGTLCPL